MSSAARVRSDRCSHIHAPVALAVGIWAAMTLVVAVLVWRRACGAFVVPTDAWVPCASATLAAMFTMAATVLLHADRRASLSRRSHILAAAASLMLPPALGLVLWTNASAAVGSYLAMLELICSAALLLISDLCRTAEKQAAATSTTGQAQSALAHVVPKSDALEERIRPVDEPGERRTAAPSESDPSVLQWMSRRQLDDGGETVEGSLRLDFAPAQKLAIAHVSFIPPLPTRPKAECHVLSDFDGRFGVAAAFSYGLRIEARRNSADKAATLEVAFTAQAPVAEVRAA